MYKYKTVCFKIAAEKNKILKGQEPDNKIGLKSYDLVSVLLC